ncbi:MAG: hypothetical protein AAF800_09725 [Planctomycetota bacterium]
MTEGLILILAAGAVFCLMGVVFSVTARRGLDMVPLMAVSGGGLAVGGLGWVDVGALRAEPVADLGRLAAVMVSAGAVSTAGMAAMHAGMKRGPQAPVWTIGQSALAVPFVAGVVVFGDTAGVVRWSGLVAILIGLVLFGLAKRPPNGPSQPPGGEPASGGLPLAFLAFAVIGLSQTLMTVPSHTSADPDPASLRVTLIGLGRMAGGIGLAVGLRARFGRAVLLWGAGMALLSLSSTSLMLAGLDALAAHGRAGIGFPVAVGICILGFVAYRIVTGREPAQPTRLAAIAACLAGIVLISL